MVRHTVCTHRCMLWLFRRTSSSVVSLHLDLSFVFHRHLSTHSHPRFPHLLLPLSSASSLASRFHAPLRAVVLRLFGCGRRRFVVSTRSAAVSVGVGEFLTPKGWIGTHPPFHRGGEKRSGPSLEKKKGNEGRWRWDQSVLSQSPHLWTFVGVPHSNGEVRPEEEKKKHRIEGSISKPRENPLFMKLSNAIPDNFNRGQALGSMAQWIRRRSTEPKIRGSIPRGVKVSTAAHHRNDVHNAMQGIHALRATAKFRFFDSVDTEAGRRHRPSTCDLRRDAR